MNAVNDIKWTMDESGRQYIVGSRLEVFGDVVAYVSDLHNVIIAFRGRSKKAFSKYRYKPERIIEALKGLKKQESDRIARKAETKARNAKETEDFLNSLEINSVLEVIWGYDQTNVDFYQIVDIKGKSVTIRQIKGDSICIGNMSYHVTPRPNDFCGEPIKKRVKSTSIKLSSFEFARLAEFEILADGTKKYKKMLETKYA